MRMPYDAPVGDLTGTATFRLMPADPFAEAPSTVDARPAAAGHALVLSYTWQHPDDGEQSGTLLLGAPTDGDAVSGAWVDSWHQPAVVSLAGSGAATRAVVGYDYAPGWSWEIELVTGEGGLTLVMRNVVPDGEPGPTGPYDVMRAAWS